MEQSFDAQGIGYALRHGLQVFPLSNPAPVDTALVAGFQHEVEPDARAAAIALHERVGHIHFHVFVEDFVEGRFGHTFYLLQLGWQVLGQAEREAAL